MPASRFARFISALWGLASDSPQFGAELRMWRANTSIASFGRGAAQTAHWNSDGSLIDFLAGFTVGWNYVQAEIDFTDHRGIRFGSIASVRPFTSAAEGAQEREV